MSSQDQAGEFLSRFPGPVTLYPSRTKWVLVLLGCAALAAAAYWMIGTGRTVVGWGGLVFFGPGTLVAAVILLPGANALKLDRQAFEITHLFRRRAYRWQDTTGFAVVSIPPSAQKMVMFDDANAKNSAMAKMNVSLVGHNSALPDTYGLPPQALASLMAQWRERAVKTH